MTITEVREWVEFLAVVLGIIGAFISFWSFRRERLEATQAAGEKAAERERAAEQERMKALRLDEVSYWGRQCIVQTRLIFHLLANDTKRAELLRGNDLGTALATLSALIDEGRLYFKNTMPTSGALVGWGKDRPSAFQGIRPRILDPLVACYDAAQRAVAGETQKSLFQAFRYAEEDFISLLQQEVGRARAASTDASEGGTGSPLTGYLRKAAALRK